MRSAPLLLLLGPLLGLVACDPAPSTGPDATLAADAGPPTERRCALPAGIHAGAVAFAAPDTMIYAVSDGDGDGIAIARGDAPPTMWIAGTSARTLIVAGHRLFFTTSGGSVWTAPLDDGSPTPVQVFKPGRPTYEAAYGLAVDAGGTVYTVDAINNSTQFRIMALPAGAGTWREITTTRIGEAIGGIAVAPDGNLLVRTMRTGEIWQITLRGGIEAGRARVVALTGFTGQYGYGVTLDDQGRMLIGMAYPPAIVRISSPTASETLAADPSAIADVGAPVLGTGCWGSRAVYVPSSPALRVVDDE